ncbi:tetratricopeptide repeat protein [Singulisphaera acidiphila]|uniref:Tetratricopeptide repeat protein n=1 Tax=Singulisphaera acidiphila (strain ATCC BAA-1392 / DSM 18658 / VKM B-2454 / MOB10) TaxID=886293 RepID=L0D5T7_SINAD|nr:tetratricopeptide repeat protein [Singulisphaera acidiphila]AGA24779.1 tetratricopeptide repeat protein [Singulisphaera acidiphila DSM 18658]
MAVDELSDDEALAMKEALRLSRAGDIGAAGRIFHTVIKSNNQNPSIFWIIGNEHSNHRMHEKAIAYFRRAIELDERCMPAWGCLGRDLMDLGRWDEAEVALRRRLELGESANHYVFLAMVLLEQSRHEDAISCCERALQLNDHQVDALTMQGFAYSLLGFHEKAVEACRRAIALDDQYDDAHTCLGVVLSRANQLDEASNAFQRALDINPQYAPAYREFGKLQHLKGDPALAESYLRSADELDREQGINGDGRNIDLG